MRDDTQLDSMPWHRQPTDTDKSFKAFQEFLSLPLEQRTYPVLAARLGKWLPQIKGWGSKHNWQERARAFDSFQARTFDETLYKANEVYQEAVIQHEMEDYQRVRELWRKSVSRVENAQRAGDEVPPLDLKRLSEVREVLSRQARRAARMPYTYADREDDMPTANAGQWVLTMDGGAKEVSALPDKTDE